MKMSVQLFVGLLKFRLWWPLMPIELVLENFWFKLRMIKKAEWGRWEIFFVILIFNIFQKRMELPCAGFDLNWVKLQTSGKMLIRKLSCHCISWFVPDFSPYQTYSNHSAFPPFHLCILHNWMTKKPAHFFFLLPNYTSICTAWKRK